MKVYVVETGLYDSRSVAGVYATAEAAMAAHPVDLPARVQLPGFASSPNYIYRAGGWQQDGYGNWDNGLDFDDYACVTEYEVKG